MKGLGFVETSDGGKVCPRLVRAAPTRFHQALLFVSLYLTDVCERARVCETGRDSLHSSLGVFAVDQDESQVSLGSEAQ